ncbi:hypothetical protein WOLCODRAFT_65402 [Wolfiporia cocos MD-104 SS10]|uniref:MutS protein homolog 3 n=1 Tax=Wolfiporia cocos (strain MD-104) TaxID=742152 RepID=A0A2H3JF82_WOLCO|nr:hypothetical protein WOLCODRAFT_65402 [Wolfiporia cocos MD-104 SS10]
MSQSSPKKQTRISHFFTHSPESPKSQSKKRRNESPIDLTVDSGDDVPSTSQSPSSRKRNRTTSSYFSSDSGLSLQKQSDVQARSGLDLSQQWRFDTASVSSAQTTRAPNPADQKRHDRARRILLGDDDFFRRSERDEADLLASAAAEEDETGPGPSQRTEEAPSRASDEETDERFTQLMEKFSGSKSKSKKGKSAPTAAQRKGKKTVEIGPSGQSYTPLELQIRELKRKYPDTILMVEVGYKMKFYGEDAKVAAKELGIMLGIVEQTETAALKKIGDNRNDVFTRGLTHMYTAATYVDELNSVDELDPSTAPPLMCLVEELKGGMGPDERVRMAMIVIAPSTGDVVWDEFEGDYQHPITRMVHSKPYELLLPDGKLSKPSEKMITHFVQSVRFHTFSCDHKIRIERVKAELTYTEAFSYLTDFYTDKSRSAVASDSFNSGKLVAAVADFPQLVTVALATAVQYLTAFDLEDALRETCFFARFAERTHMLLNSNTLTNLEIYRNETDFTAKGSLLWILNQTTTKFGARLLRSWVGRPLTDTKILRERIDAVEEILQDESPKLTRLRDLLRRLPDLARGLCRIQYGKCTPQELAILLTTFNEVATAFPLVSPQSPPFRSPLLNNIISALPKLREPVQGVLQEISLKVAKEGNKEALWIDPEKFPLIDDLTMSIRVVESELKDELKNIRKTIKKPALTYTTWNGEEYVVEINKNENRDIPLTWQIISRCRYRTPKAREKLDQRNQLLEALAAEAKRAYLSFLQEIIQNHYALLRDAVNKLAIADCLLSLARIALQEGYVKPEFTEDDILEIVDARHPMIESLVSEPFVSNTIVMGNGQPRSKIITGPNMGGKSSTVRMIALCAIMAQIGSYVPASSMKLAALDGILTRMGAADELARGRSTFMVEMQETSDIIQMATPRTLVILDELGRGTSTFDGMAIAHAVLQHLVQTVNCRTLFITHYPEVASDLERKFPEQIQNLHMGYTEETRVDGTREVTFLYRLTSGITEESFGVECGRLAEVPESVLQLASIKSQNMRALVKDRVRRNRYVVDDRVNWPLFTRHY